MTNDSSSVLVEGPWTHRFVSANGARFHVAEAGEGPMVLLLHGFPQFWWAWRDQLTALAAAGYHAAAIDLRGYGASDKPPHGYDTFTSAADVASVVRSLGATQAVVVGHGLGAWTAWAMPSMQPTVTAAVAALSMPHPLVMRRASMTEPAQMRANAYVVGMQRPFVAERQMAGGALGQLGSTGYVEHVLARWAAPDGGWPERAVASRYADAMALPFVAHSAAEYYRWIGRSQLRLDGRRFVARMRRPVRVPVLQLQGERDGAIIASATQGSSGYAAGRYQLHVVADAGHFLHEEATAEVNERLISWLASVT